MTKHIYTERTEHATDRNEEIRKLKFPPLARTQDQSREIDCKSVNAARSLRRTN
jgi:hypothetical protein